MTLPLVPLLIDGIYGPGATGATVPVVNPATEAVIADLAHAATADLDRALQASARAFTTWKATTAAHRHGVLIRAAALIRNRQDEIAAILTAENGKSLSEAAREVGFCADATDWYAEEAKRAYGRVIPARSPDARKITLREPVGVALGFAGWNFPAGNVTLKMAAALAADRMKRCPMELDGHAPVLGFADAAISNPVERLVAAKVRSARRTTTGDGAKRLKGWMPICEPKC